MKKFIKNSVHSFIAQNDSANLAYNRYKLSQYPSIPYNTDNLGNINKIVLSNIFHNNAIEDEWNKVEKQINPLITGREGTINLGDRKAIYYVIKYLQPKTVLEIGTHLGTSTAYIASAMKNSKAQQQSEEVYSLVTVDIRDVNDPISKPWQEFGSTYSPRELARHVNCEDLITFTTGDSAKYLAETGPQCDLIFLDGDHSAHAVYQEVPHALSALRPGGFILLHDYFPDFKPLWSDGVMKPGPDLAIQRLQKEGADIKVKSFGALPWPTKRNSNVTSLALLGRDI